MPNDRPITLLLAGPPDATAVWRGVFQEEPFRLLPDVTQKADLPAALAARPEALLIDGRLFAGVRDLIGHLTLAQAAVYVVLPEQATEVERNAIAAVVCVKGMYRTNLNLAKLARRIVRELQGEAQAADSRWQRANSETQPFAISHLQSADHLPILSASHPLPTGLVRARIRLGFYGTRGGAGVSTAALLAAQALADAGLRVALFDATGRGDLHLMLGLQPPSAAASPCEASAQNETPVTRGGITLFLSVPSEDAASGFEAIIVDGGRARGAFNADWVTLTDPLPGDAIRRLVGLELIAGPSRPAFSLSRLLPRPTGPAMQSPRPNPLQGAGGAGSGAERGRREASA